MATSSYANLFGTTGSGKKQGVGFGNLFGQQQAPKAVAQPQDQPARTFAQMQAAGEARPAPQQVRTPAQPPMLQQLQDQLQMPVFKAQPKAPPPAGTEYAAPGTTITTTMAPGAVNPYTGEVQPPEPKKPKVPAGEVPPAAPPTEVPPPAAPLPEEVPAAPPTEAPPTDVPPTPPAEAPDGGPLPTEEEKKPTTPGPSADVPPSGPPSPSSAYDDLIRQIQDILKQPAGYSNEEMAKIRAARTAELEETFGAQRSALEEEMARRGLSASTIGAGRFGDLGGQQARALSTLEANLLQQQMDAQDRARAQQLTTLAALSGKRADIWQSELERQLKEKLGLAEFEGTIGGKETLQARTQRMNLAIQLAQAIAGSNDPEAIKNIMPYIYQIFGITPPPSGEDDTDTTTTTTPRSGPSPSGPASGPTGPSTSGPRGGYR